MEAAARVLETEGPDGFNTNAVARRAGVSIGSLYQYFPSKAALVAELSRRNAEAVMAGLAEAAARTEGQPLAQRMRALIRAGVALQAARPQLSRTLDQMEPGLGLPTDEAATAPAIEALLVPILAAGAPDPAPASLGLLAGDVLAIVRVLVDRALAVGDEGMVGVEDRAFGALSGYLAAAGVVI